MNYKLLLIAISGISITLIVVYLFFFNNSTYSVYDGSNSLSFGFGTSINVVLIEYAPGRVKQNFDIGSFANIEIIHPRKTIGMSIGNNVIIDFISRCDSKNPNHINCFNVFVNQNLGSGVAAS
jgi:hypothetical protein